MVALSRRSFLASSVAVAAHPALAIPVSSGIDVIIVGAGAAGIAAARRIFAAGRKLTIFEASDRMGGRCFTDMRTFGIPYDRGAHWIHTTETNPGRSKSCWIQRRNWRPSLLPDRRRGHAV
jgi:choline dehydrogenase-like flavoprotein